MIVNCFDKKPLDEALDLDLIEISELIATITKDNLENYKNV